MTNKSTSLLVRLVMGLERSDRDSSDGKLVERSGSPARLVYWFEARLRDLREPMVMRANGVDKLLDARDNEVNPENLIRDAI